MATFTLTDELRAEYLALFNTCHVNPERLTAVDETIGRISCGRARYDSVASQTGVPWHVIGVIHSLECSCSFKKHLHNGDPLDKPTLNVPAGRPRNWGPPYEWERSAKDALEHDRFAGRTDWRLTTSLFRLEAYNGSGYRNKGIFTPYLWSFANHYVRGKYVLDGRYDPEAVSQQVGAAVLLRRMAERGLVEFPDRPWPAPQPAPVKVRFAKEPPADAETRTKTLELQHWINTFPGFSVETDGWPGLKTSAALRAITGAFLDGDPCAA